MTNETMTRYDSTPAIVAEIPANRAPGWSAGILRNLLPAQCIAGQLSIRLPSNYEIVCSSPHPGPQAQVEIKRWRGLRRMALGGNLGFAQAFIDGDCECRDLQGLFAWALANDEVLSRFGAGSVLLRWLARQTHRMNANTLRGSRRNIAAHYDLGNAFYETWLDAGMNYSSALYVCDARESLEAAQTAKLDRIVDLLDLKGGERVLEIGCGWGALAERLLAVPESHLTALTLSQRQLEFTRRRLASAQLAERADVRLQDYRHVEGTYDRIASIEMLEAVGQRYWPVYFDTLRCRLAPGGIAVLQVITIKPDRFAAYARDPDFIQHYIFPGGMLPSVPILKDEIGKAGLKLTASQTFGVSYAKTLSEWRSRFLSAWPQLKRMGFDERFQRMWIYYLTYCEEGFQAGELDVGLYRIERPKTAP